MERRKLTKEDIDKVRNIEGFPIGTDEDIIALSDAPFYTACPNPFIEEFIKEYGAPYDEATELLKHSFLISKHRYIPENEFSTAMRTDHYIGPNCIINSRFLPIKCH